MLPSALPVLFIFCALLVGAKCNYNESILIIGAGASGIAAATRLLKHEFHNVKILEAEDRIGGRIHSVKFKDAYVDFGAEYCHGEEDNIVYTMTNQFNILESRKPEYILYYSEDGDEINIDVHELLFDLAHRIAHRKYFNTTESDACFNMISEGVCLKENFDQLEKNARGYHQSVLIRLSYDWLRSYKSATESCIDLDDVSLVSDLEECKGDQMLEWRGYGFKTILNIMMQNHPEQMNKIDVKILLKNRVAHINNWKTGSKVEIELEGGDIYFADHVIFTPSLGALKATHKNMFSPPLFQEKVNAIENIGFGVVVKIALYFKEPWWVTHAPRMWGCIFSSEHNSQLEKENLTWVRHFTAFTAAPNNSHVLFGWFAGQESPAIELLDYHDILRGIRFILGKCFVGYPDLDMPEIMEKTKWWTNPNFRGSHSYDSVKGFLSGDRSLREKLGSPILNENGVPTLLFAGEATHQTKFATVHGAIESGYREADRIISYYKTKT